MAIVHVRVELRQHSTQQAGNRPQHRLRRHGNHPGCPRPALTLSPADLNDLCVAADADSTYIRCTESARGGLAMPGARTDRSPFVMVTGPTPSPPAGRSRVRCYSHSSVEPAKGRGGVPHRTNDVHPVGLACSCVPGLMDWVLDVVQAQHVQCSPTHVYYGAPQ